MGLKEIMMPRIRFIAPDEAFNFERIFDRRANEWDRWQRVRWQGLLKEGDVPLLREAGSYINPEFAPISWATPKSMRNVDAECQVEITNLYLTQEEEQNA
jgi:hypothetical protein